MFPYTYMFFQFISMTRFPTPILYNVALILCFSLITGCCYKFLENPATVKNGTTKDLIFNLLGVMVKKYNHGLGKNTFSLAISYANHG